MTRVAASLAAVAASLLLAACGPYAPRDLPVVGAPEDLVGAWERTDDDGTEVTLDIRPDVTVAYAGIPRELGDIDALADPGGFLDFSSLHFFCADPDLGPSYEFERAG